MRPLLLTLCLATLLSAQSTQFEIRGTVSEPGLGGIAGAEVQTILVSPDGERPISSVFTDGRGQFVVRTSTPGNYLLVPSLDGYAAEFIPRTPALLDAEHSRVDVQLSMIRPGQALGRVLDAETREPIEGILVSVVQKNMDPKAALPPIADSLEAVKRQAEERKTKADGTFTVSGLRPGDYALTIARAGELSWSAGYTAQDLKVVGQDYENVFWPGGVPLDAVRPIAVGSGAVVSFGDMLLRKIPNYSAHVSLAQGDCPVGESMRVTLFRAGMSPAKQVASCGSELLLHGLEPGSYHLYAVSDWQGERDHIENAAWATTQFEISRKNVEVTLIPQRGVILEAQLIVADPKIVLPDRIVIGMSPEALAPGMQPSMEDFTEWLQDGKFRLAVSPRTQILNDLRTSGVSAFVKQLRYNGTPLPDLKVPVNPGASTQRLEVVLDNHFGALSVTVAGADQRTMVSLWKDGESFPRTMPAGNRAFRFEALAPGEYRVSIGSGNAVFRSDTDQRVTIRPGETTTINVRAEGASK